MYRPTALSHGLQIHTLRTPITKERKWSFYYLSTVRIFLLIGCHFLPDYLFPDRLVESPRMKRAFETVYNGILPKGASPFIYLRFVIWHTFARGHSLVMPWYFHYSACKLIPVLWTSMYIPRNGRFTFSTKRQLLNRIQTRCRRRLLCGVTQEYSSTRYAIFFKGHVWGVFLSWDFADVVNRRCWQVASWSPTTRVPIPRNAREKRGRLMRKAKNQRRIVSRHLDVSIFFARFYFNLTIIAQRLQPKWKRYPNTKCERP